jgi:uncharacterized repeat protein (TIGR01451 family)
MRLGKWVGLPALSAFAAAAVAILVLAGSGTAASGSDLAASTWTVAKTKSYLRSIGVNPRGVAIQHGQRNYAGRHCPGKRWNCTNATRVLQWGGVNSAECAPADAVVRQSNDNPPQTCEIIQINPGGSNEAQCTQLSSAAAAVQFCKIVQVGAQNGAVVEQIVESDGQTLSASQHAVVDQSGATDENRLQLNQSVTQIGEEVNAGDPQQDSWQRADVVQEADLLGNNVSRMAQSQWQRIDGGTMQLQNTGTNPLGDCNPNHAGTNPSMCLNLSQSGDEGINFSEIREEIAQRGWTDQVAVQTQGSSGGGTDARVHQEAGPEGHSANDVVQTKLQEMVGEPGSSQTQIDPISCCGFFSQEGGSGNSEVIDQSVTQDASEAGATQDSQMLGESKTPSGSCTMDQRATNNGDSTTNSATQSPCPFLLLETSCSNSGEGGDCTASEPVTTPPDEGSPDSTLAKEVRNVSQEGSFGSTATSSPGNTIEYRIVYTNTGDGTAHSVTLSDTPPTAFDFGTCTGDCTVDSGGTISWSLGDVPADETRTVTFRGVRGDSCGTDSNSALGSSKEEGGFESNSATVTQVCID